MQNLSDKLSSIYGEPVKVLGPYACQDGRLRADVRTSSGAKTQQYARLLLEAKIGRRLYPSETVDHVDEDFTNDSPDNLQVLTLKENAAKGAAKPHREANCKTCSALFVLSKDQRSARSATKRKFCSSKCKYSFMRV